MKTTLLILLFTSCTIHAQTQINTLNGNLTGNPADVDGVNYRSYITFSESTAWNQTPAGFDKVWDISGFTIANGYKIYKNTTPTANEGIQYPGSSMVSTESKLVNNATTVTGKTYSTNAASNLTGYSDTSLTLKYSSDNASWGTFPQTYGDLHVDTVAGTYVFGEYQGTFTGTMITEVDAYGTMITATDGTLSVTRLKTVETLQISYPGFGIVGSYSKTIYRYYRSDDLWPFVKSTNTVMNVALLSIDSNVTQIEKYAPINLSLNENSLTDQLVLYPNPSSGEINISVSSQKIASVKIIDATGKTVLNPANANFDLSHLQSGIYTVVVVTEKGIASKKIIKK